jgi:hypothetical protein
MAVALRQRGVDFEELDVDTDPALEERYGELVPVLVKADGTEVCHYHLDEGALQKALLK